MKRTILLMVVIVTLSIISSNVWAIERYNYGKVWKSWSDNERHVYIWGFSNGLFEGWRRTFEQFVTEKYKTKGGSFQMPPELEKANREMDLEFETNAIKDVVTDLYKDPSNAFISFTNMIYVARNKIKGEK